MAHKSTFAHADEYESIKEGDIITAYFYGYSIDQKLTFGKDTKDLGFLTGKFDKYINTTVEVTVRKSPNNKNEYFVDNLYPAILSVTKITYPNNKNIVKKNVANFTDNEKIICQVLGINNKQKKIQLKLITI